MTATISTSVEHLEGNKVRLHVAVPAQEFEKALDRAFRKIAAEVRVPGFRPGKAPRRLLEARLGSDAAREQALRDSLPEYYSQAVEAERVDVIAPPEIDITAGEDGGDVEFDAVVEVRPVVEVDGYDGIRVEIPAPTVDDAAVDEQVDQLRGRFATLEDSPRALADGDFAEIDIRGTVDGEPVDGLSATDFLYEVGSALLVPSLDAQLHGRRPGDIVGFDDRLPERFGERAGQTVTFQVLVKDARRRVLPDLTDDWVAEVSELSTVDELRADVRRRLELMAAVQARMAVRDRVLEAAAALVPIDPPGALVDQETQRRLQDLHVRLQPQGVNIPQWLAATGQDQEAFVASVREGAAAAVRADLALRAVVRAEGVEASDEEVDAEVARLAERAGVKPDRARRDLERGGGLEAVRSDIARGKALQFLVDHAVVVDEAGNPLDLTLPDVAATGDTEPVGAHSGGSLPEESEA